MKKGLTGRKKQLIIQTDGRSGAPDVGIHSIRNGSAEDSYFGSMIKQAMSCSVRAIGHNGTVRTG